MTTEWLKHKPANEMNEAEWKQYEAQQLAENTRQMGQDAADRAAWRKVR